MVIAIARWVRPWKLPAEHDDVRPPGRLLGELHRGLGDLGAGVGEEERVDCAGRELGELGGERLEQVVGEHVDLGVDEPLGLLGDRGDDLRVAVAGGVDGDAGGEVEVLVAIGGRDPAAASAATCRSVTLNHTFDRCDACFMPGMLRLPARCGRERGKI